MTNDQAIVCRPESLTAEERERKELLMRRLADAVDERMELRSGYRFRYRTDRSTWGDVAEFVELERRCCPFFTFEAGIEAGGGPVWLSLTGGVGVKEFLEAQMQVS